MNQSGSPQESPTPAQVPKPSDLDARMADPDEVRRGVEELLDRAERAGDPAEPHHPAGAAEARSDDPADLFERAHEVLLEALSTVDRN